MTINNAYTQVRLYMSGGETRYSIPIPIRITDRLTTRDVQVEYHHPQTGIVVVSERKHLNKNGSGLYFTIPKSIIDSRRLKVGQRLHIRIANDTIYLSPVGPYLTSIFNVPILSSCRRYLAFTIPADIITAHRFYDTDTPRPVRLYADHTSYRDMAIESRRSNHRFYVHIPQSVVDRRQLVAGNRCSVMVRSSRDVIKIIL